MIKAQYSAILFSPRISSAPMFVFFKVLGPLLFFLWDRYALLFVSTKNVKTWKYDEDKYGNGESVDYEHTTAGDNNGK